MMKSLLMLSQMLNKTNTTNWKYLVTAFDIVILKIINIVYAITMYVVTAN